MNEIAIGPCLKVELRGEDGARVFAERPHSLSKSHNCIEGNFHGPELEQPDLPFRLNGSQAKTAFALRLNIERLVSESGIATVGFLTLTIGDARGGKFMQIFDSTEASRRVHSLSTNLLPHIFSRWVIVTERHKNGAIHFHVVGALRSRADIRTGFDWKSLKDANSGAGLAATRKYVASASPALRDAWRMLRQRLPGYGFGRAQLTPIETTGGAVASYVSKYVEKNLFNRLAADKGKKLVRYGGWDKRQLKPNEFSWGTPRATAWRLKARALAGTVGISDRDHMAKAYGPRWAFHITRIMHAVDDSPTPGFAWTWPEREASRRLMIRASVHPQKVAVEPWHPNLWRIAA